MMGLARLYNTVFNFFFLLVSLVMVGFSVYFVIDNNSTLAKAILGVSAFYLIVSAAGVVSRFLNFGYAIFLGLLLLITLFQAACLVLISFWQEDALDKLRDMDGGDYAHALTAYDFIEDNTLIVQIASGVLILIYIGAFIAAYILKVHKQIRSSPSGNDNQSNMV